MVSPQLSDTEAVRQGLPSAAPAPTPCPGQNVSGHPADARPMAAAAPGRPRIAASPPVHTWTHLNRAWTWD